MGGLGQEKMIETGVHGCCLSLLSPPNPLLIPNIPDPPKPFLLPASPCICELLLCIQLSSNTGGCGMHDSGMAFAQLVMDLIVTDRL